MDFRFSNKGIFLTKERWQILKVWLRSIFLEDWVTKIIALVIALGLWYGVTSRRVPTERRFDNVRLDFKVPLETEISNEVLTTNVEITLTGDRSRIDTLNPRDLVVGIDLSNYKPDELVVPLKPETVNLDLSNGDSLSNEVKLAKIEPSLISIRLEPRIEKLVEVKPVFTGQLPETLEIYQTIITPSKVRVRGAASRVNALDRVPTEEIELRDKTGSFVEKQITVNLPDQKITVLDAVIDVAVTIGERRIEKTLTNVKAHSPNEEKFTPETAVVTLYGAGSVLEKLLSEELHIALELDLDGSLKPRVVLPPDVQDKIEVRSIKPSVFLPDK